MAEKLGYFDDAGLDVSIQTPSDPAAPTKLVAAGQSDLAISYEPEVLLAHEQRPRRGRDRGARRQPPDFDDLAGEIRHPRDRRPARQDDRDSRHPLPGRLPEDDPRPRQPLPGDVSTVNVGFGLLPAILGGKADAMLGGFRNVEGVDLRLRGKAPVVTPVDQLGVPTYAELVLLANRERLEEDPEPYRLFLAALSRGTAAAVKSPEATVGALLEANPDLDPKLTRAEVDATLPLLSADGRMDAAAWAEFIGWMAENELIGSEPAPSQVLSNDYLPGTIPE